MSSPDDLAKDLKEEWERRARSPSREFFVASHEGWDTEEGRERQARSDAILYLTDVDLDVARTQDVLEIGCGSGRLVPYIAPHFRSYTGFDVSKTMLEAARKSCGSLPNVRFFETDGASVPEGARDRLYDFAFSAGVLIHCPKPVCESLVASALRQMKRGGQLRIQLLADHLDPEGVLPGRDTTVAEVASRIEQAITPEQAALIEGTRYMGHRFRYAEAKAWLDSAGDAFLVRVDPLHIYALVTKR